MAEEQSETALIIGAGPAGLTAALEFLRHTKIKPIVLEMSEYMGGLSRTVVYKGNRIDIGGHRFFSKSNVVIDWWLQILPLASPRPGQRGSLSISYQNKSRLVHLVEPALDPEIEDNLMLVRERLSRVYFMRKFFDYPIRLNFNTILNLGPWRMLKSGLSYLSALLFQIKPEKHLEDFFINRFGGELYRLFFRDYTEKVWGVKCTEIAPDWGHQRIKGLSVGKAVLHALGSVLQRKDGTHERVETSLIERFMYPKLGPGQMWERVAEMVQDLGGQIRTQHKVTALHWTDGRIAALEMLDMANGQKHLMPATYFISTMPIRELISCLHGQAIPQNVREVANGLQYRDFITVGLLLNKLKVKDSSHPSSMLADTWIYIQEPEVKVGRLQIFNNWSPYLVADPDKIWIGMEYFCNEGDQLWAMDNASLAAFAIGELASIEIIDPSDVVDHVVIRMPKSYPGYFGTYSRFDEIRQFLDPIPNLYLIGRNGMHRYNNQDHSMLTAIEMVANIAKGCQDKANLWAINTEQIYQERVPET